MNAFYLVVHHLGRLDLDRWIRCSHLDLAYNEAAKKAQSWRKLKGVTVRGSKAAGFEAVRDGRTVRMVWVMEVKE